MDVAAHGSNGAVLSLVIAIVYIVALMYYCDGAILQGDLKSVDYHRERLMAARTVTFISLV